LDEFNPEYARINLSIMGGISRYERIIPTRRGGVTRLMYHNLVVGDGKPVCESKPLPPEFTSFEQYQSYLATHLGGIIVNARDAARANPLRILSTQSSGYDSTAINALVRCHGLDLALTIGESKEKWGYYRRRKKRRPSDSGADIARCLGVDFSLMDRRYFEKHPEAEYLYWACLHNNQDLNLHQVREHVGDGAVLFTGTAGDALWRNAASTTPDQFRLLNDQLMRADLAGNGLSEVRLHSGYIHVPVPYIGARSRKSLFHLANSGEMSPWSIGGTYDRPVPRRIAEEAGVPRHLFGQRKLASVVESLPPYLPHGKALRGEFFRFIRQRRALLPLWLSLAPGLNAFLINAGRVKRRIPFLKRLPKMPGVAGSLDAVLYAFCVNKAADYYADRLSSTKGSQHRSTLSNKP
jgi:hypothetical protein